ncbi:hypothetical protein TNCV_1263001 [Trichonephila clavipes]|nr:hypothetical protein TNCV_1263001 [Trichonephila clavipes]
MIQSESAHSALTQVSKIIMNLELFRTIGSASQQLATHQHNNITVAPHLLTAYGMEARFASHMPNYCTVKRYFPQTRWRHDSSESCVFLLQSRVTNVGIDSKRSPSDPDASTLSITPRRSSSHDV